MKPFLFVAGPHFPGTLFSVFRFLVLLWRLFHTCVNFFFQNSCLVRVSISNRRYCGFCGADTLVSFSSSPFSSPLFSVMLDFLPFFVFFSSGLIKALSWNKGNQIFFHFLFPMIKLRYVVFTTIMIR